MEHHRTRHTEIVTVLWSAMRPVGLLVLLFLLTTQVANAYIFEFTDNGVPIYWPALRQSTITPIPFFYNARGSARLGGALPGNTALKDVLDQCFARWSNVSSATVQFGSSQISSTSAVESDDVNLVVFTSANSVNFTGADGPYIVGLTTTSFIPSTGVLVDTDIQFNDTSKVFSLSLTARTGDESNSGSFYINLADVATHEIGHALGLDHTGVKGACMYFAAADGGRDLAPDDVAGISALYPASGFNLTTGILSGHVRNSGPIFGAHVLAIDTTTGRVAASAITGSDGTYEIKGLPPGRYVVLAEPLKPNALGTYYQPASSSFNTGFHAPDSTSAPTVVTVKPNQESSNIDIFVTSARTDPSGGTSLATAIPLSIGQAASRHLPASSQSHPQDYFAFEATCGTTITFNVVAHRLWVPIDPKLEIVDSALNVLAGPSQDSSSSSPFDLDDQLLFNPPKAGTQTYYVRVKSSLCEESSFPDSRSIKDGESLYLLTSRRMSINTPPKIVQSASLSTITTQEATEQNSRVISVDLTGLSTDAEDPISSLTWSVSGVSTALFTVDDSSLNASPPKLKISPVPHRSGTGTMTLALSDAEGATASLAINVTIVPVNDPPKAVLNLTQVSSTGAPRTINLDASSSSACSDGDTSEASQGLVYSWTQVYGPTPANVDGVSSPTYRFAARDAGSYSLRLTVTETNSASPLTASTDVCFFVENVPPVPRVIAPQVALPGQKVFVRADLSTDANESLTTAAFSLTSLSTVSSIVPSRESTAAFSFIAPGTAGRYPFELKVTDSGFLESSGVRSRQWTSVTTFAVEVRNLADLPPTADAGPDRIVSAGDLVTLDGRESRSPSGETLSYSWEQVSNGTATVSLSAATTSMANFYAPTVPGTYRFQLIVTGTRTGLSSPSAVSQVRVLGTSQASNRYPPVARARMSSPTSGAPVPGEVVTLDGTESSDPEGASITYRWKQIDGPAVVLSSPQGSTSTFTPAATGTYRFRLSVSDGEQQGPEAQIEVHVGLDGYLPESLVVSASQPAVSGSARGSGQELRFTVDGTSVSSNRIELAASLASGGARRYLWEQVRGPRVPVDMSSDGSVLSFVPLQVRVHSFVAYAIDPFDRVVRQTVHVIVDHSDSHVPRAALSTTTLSGTSGQSLTLDGSASRDLVGSGEEQANENMVYYWQQEDGPPVALAGSMTAQPTFTPPSAGRYAFRLLVDNQRDGTLSAPTDGLLVTTIIAASTPTSTSSATQTDSSSSDSDEKKATGCMARRANDPGLDLGGMLALFLPLVYAQLIAWGRAWPRRGLRLPRRGWLRS